MKPSKTLSPNPTLDGATLVVTRPAATAAALVRRIRARHGTALSLPGLSLRAVTPTELVQANASERRDGWIFISPAAVRYAFRAAPSLHVADRALVCAVGAGTQRALARHGVTSLAPRDRADSEGLLALPELASVDGWRIGLVGAPGGRDLIAATLRARGAEVESIHVYRRAPPRLTRRHFDALAHAPDPLITLISSGEALAHLVDLLPADALARLRRQALVVSSARLAELARANAFEEVHVAASAMPADLLAAAQKALARHRL